MRLAYIIYLKLKFYLNTFFRYGFLFPNFYVDKDVLFQGYSNIRIDKGVQILRRSILSTYPNPYGDPLKRRYSKGTIEIGEKTKIKNDVQLFTYGGTIKIGNNCSLNPYCIVYGHGDVMIGNDTLVASGTKIVSSNHKYINASILIRNQGIETKGISIGNDVWIGSNCVILDGAIISDGVVVAANSIVRGHLESYSVYGGSPVKFIKKRQ